MLLSGWKKIYYKSKSVIERFSQDQLKAIDRLQKATGVTIEQI